MKKLVTLIVEKSNLSLFTALVIALVGVITIPHLKISRNPTLEFPYLKITLTLPGASAQDIEQRAVRLIEQELYSIQHIDEFKIWIDQGGALAHMRYDYGVDIDDEFQEVTSRIDKIKPDLPSELQVVVEKGIPSSMIVHFVYGVVSKSLKQDTRVEIAEELKRLYKDHISGIAEVDVLAPEKEITVTPDLNRLNQYGLTIQDIITAIQSENRILPTGTLEFGETTLSLLPPEHPYKHALDIQETLLVNPYGNPIRLKELAQVHEQLSPHPISSRINAIPATLITVKVKVNSNILTVKKQLKSLTEEYCKKLPDDVSINLIYNAQEKIVSGLSGLMLTLLQGILILAVVLLFAVGYRSMLAILVSLPLSLGFALVLLSLTDHGLQQISIAGFIISLGLIVDNAIVITENAYMLTQTKSLNRKDAAIEGTSSVVWPLITSTLTTSLAFTPLYLLTSEESVFLRSMPLTIWFSLSASLLVACTFSTIFLSRIGTRNYIKYLPSPPNLCIALIPFRDKIFVTTLRWIIQHPFFLLSFMIAALSCAGFIAKKLDTIMFPDGDEPYLAITIEGPEDSSPKLLDSILRKIEYRISKYPEIQQYTTTLGYSFPKVDFGIDQVRKEHFNGMIFCNVNLRDSAKIKELANTLNTELADFSPYAKVNVASFMVGRRGSTPAIALNLSANNNEDIRFAALEIQQWAKTIPGIRSMDSLAYSKLHSVRMHFDPLKAHAIGVPKELFNQVVTMMTHGYEVTPFYNQQGKQIPIMLRIPPIQEDPLSILDRLYIPSKKGKAIPLSQIASLVFDEKEFRIIHKDFKPTMPIEIYPEPGVKVASLTQAIQTELDKHTLPPGVNLHYEGEVEEIHKAFSGIGKYTGIIALIIFGIFILQFNSLVQPLIIYAAIPLCTIGSIIMLWLTHLPLSFCAFIGLTGLIGIVVNDSILLVHEGNRIYSKHPEKSFKEIGVEAARSRFMPVLLTSITTIAALIPMALSQTMFQPLAIVIIGGLFTSTFFTLFCIPTLYAYLTVPQKRQNK
jgi:multidrug efflux pump subunit AcrB